MTGESTARMPHVLLEGLGKPGEDGAWDWDGFSLKVVEGEVLVSMSGQQSVVLRAGETFAVGGQGLPLGRVTS